MGSRDKHDLERETMSNTDRDREKELRNAAHAETGEVVVAGSGRSVEPREIKQMLSVRLEPELIAALRRLATNRGQSTSDLVREALVRLTEAESAQHVSFYGFQAAWTPSGFVAATNFSYWDGQSVRGQAHERTGQAVIVESS
jgi:hypothetical protein